ncbi:MAG: acyl-CoA reductase [Bacteroidetes bacterium]|nr:acyl-CoA reductase [Bacteroidota bacterium]
MELNRRIEAFAFLGGILKGYPERKGEENGSLYDILDDAVTRASNENPWFVREFIEHTLGDWSVNLEKEKIVSWLRPYEKQLKGKVMKKDVAVIMAGNIPLVGLHDFLSVLISGNHFTGRLSSGDPYLLPTLAKILIRFDPGWEVMIAFTGEKLTGFDAVIATGSNNSANYFEYYFSKYPHIIRKNRNAIAILNGHETEDELAGLADDVFLYFGMGCRNVSKLYVPAGYDFSPLFLSFRSYERFIRHHKWMNNHEYYNSVFLLNGIPALDNGFMLLTENKLIASPPAVLYYEFYEDATELMTRLSVQQDEIQVVVCTAGAPLPHCLPGQAQSPALTDYADEVNTLQFLLQLS